ncbi:MAG: hypothetical protein H6581_23740 [Bacteroidia bacterium]|nr:hypothetical protein [Bacteroidia bacterium]
MKTRILVADRHPEILEKVISMLEKNGYAPTGRLKDEQIIMELMMGEYEIFLIGGSVQMTSREVFKRILASSKPGMQIIEQYGGPENLVNLLGASIPLVREE